MFRLALLFEVGLRRRESVLGIPLHGNIIAGNHVARLMAGHLQMCFSGTPASAMLRVAVYEPDT